MIYKVGDKVVESTQKIKGTVKRAESSRSGETYLVVWDTPIKLANNLGEANSTWCVEKDLESVQ